jgi:hypothetical protein
MSRGCLSGYKNITPIQNTVLLTMTPDIEKQQVLKRLTHEVFINKSKHRAAKRWCEEHLGNRWDILENREGIWSLFWGPADKDNEWQSHYRFCFAEESDALWFSLRWQ